MLACLESHFSPRGAPPLDPGSGTHLWTHLPVTLDPPSRPHGEREGEVEPPNGRVSLRGERFPSLGSVEAMNENAARDTC